MISTPAFTLIILHQSIKTFMHGMGFCFLFVRSFVHLFVSFLPDDNLLLYYLHPTTKKAKVYIVTSKWKMLPCSNLLQVTLSECVRLTVCGPTCVRRENRVSLCDCWSYRHYKSYSLAVEDVFVVFFIVE